MSLHVIQQKIDLLNTLLIQSLTYESVLALKKDITDLIINFNDISRNHPYDEVSIVEKKIKNLRHIYKTKMSTLICIDLLMTSNLCTLVQNRFSINPFYRAVIASRQPLPSPNNLLNRPTLASSLEDLKNTSIPQSTNDHMTPLLETANQAIKQSYKQDSERNIDYINSQEAPYEMSDKEGCCIWGPQSELFEWAGEIKRRPSLDEEEVSNPTSSKMNVLK